ncbi:MAG TPA: purine-nucleoside phosphorylase [Anaerolineae bacterium]|nr:purine-nucleoside phosphorylase [Anaerolineae bacterium]
MSEFITRRQVDQAVAAIRGRVHTPPKVGLVLGSGLATLADAVESSEIVDYADIPHWPGTSVEGHLGRLVIGSLEGAEVLVMQGRAHFYEGYSMAQATFPIRVMQFLGIHTLIITNAAGGVNVSFKTGDVMLITDQINLIGMAGHNPLRGPNDPSFGPRFPDMSKAYDPELGSLARQVAREQSIDLREGVYICLAGPSFESPADVRFLRAIGADAVGMSTVPEVIVARHGGLRVLGLSGISNALPPEGVTQVTSHQEVLEAGQVIVPKMTAIVRGVLRAMKV